MIKNYFRILKKPHAYLQTILKAPIKFQKDRTKNVGGVKGTMYLLKIWNHAPPATHHGKPKTVSLRFSLKRRGTKKNIHSRWKSMQNYPACRVQMCWADRLRKFSVHRIHCTYSQSPLYRHLIRRQIHYQRPKGARNHWPGLCWSYVTLCHCGHPGYQIRLPLAI